jgi:hypothetical protein
MGSNPRFRRLERQTRYALAPGDGDQPRTAMVPSPPALALRVRGGLTATLGAEGASAAATSGEPSAKTASAHRRNATLAAAFGRRRFDGRSPSPSDTMLPRSIPVALRDLSGILGVIIQDEGP